VTRSLLKRLIVPVAAALLGGSPSLVRADDPSPRKPDYRRYTVAMHVHSLISPNGRVMLNAIAAQAKKDRIDVLIPTDHFLMRWEYGLSFLPGILKATVYRSCVLKFGPAHYLNLIRKIQKDVPEVLIIPGLEVAPTYDWLGHPFEGNLTLFGSQRHLLVLGLQKAEDYLRLPVRSNPHAGEFRWRHLVLPVLLVLAGLALMIRWPAGLLVVVAGSLLILNERPFRRLPEYFYNWENNGYRAAQHLIDTVDKQGGLTVWCHPEAPNWSEAVRLYRNIFTKTDPYPDCVLQTSDHTGFSYFWEGAKTIGITGGLWDRALLEHCAGRRDRPVWAFGELDWIEEKHLDVTLDSLVNVAWCTEKSTGAVMDALRSGRFYVYLSDKKTALTLARWELSAGRQTALSGETLDWTPDARLTIRIDSPRAGTPVHGEIIKNGVSWKTFDGELPLSVVLPLKDQPDAKDYYRFVVNGAGTLVGNPIFIRKNPQ